MMLDLINILDLIQKMRNANLIPDDQVETLAEKLISTMKSTLAPGVYSTFEYLLDQVNSNEKNPLFIDIM